MSVTGAANQSGSQALSHRGGAIYADPYFTYGAEPIPTGDIGQGELAPLLIKRSTRGSVSRVPWWSESSEYRDADWSVNSMYMALYSFSRRAVGYI